MRSGQRFAAQLLKQLQELPSGGSGGTAADTSLQRAAMLAAARRMAHLGMEVYWQPFGGAGRTDSESFAEEEEAANRWGFAANNDNGSGGLGRQNASSTGQAGSCANLHGVLRSPRGDGKEALVLVTPLALAGPLDYYPGSCFVYLQAV